ncbi:hypothetical protein FRC07_004970 [Ceratobasidium sp. 392]|nr:hypothetical protein FRC07_004970 [Ceratobasidium sp. 392]
MSETLGQKTITIPWTEGLKLGDGFRQFERTVVSRAAVQPFSVKTTKSLGKEIMFRSMTIVDQQSMRQQIGASLKVEAPVYGVPVRIEASFLNSAEYNDTTMTTFIEMTIKEKSAMYEKDPILTKEAADILAKGPNEFRKNFGEYFVAGYIAQSSLVATCVFSAKDSKTMNEFKLKAGADIKPVSVEGTVNLSRTAQSMGVSVRISTHVVGLSMKPEQKGLNVNEIQSTLDDFKKNHQPREYTAILVSFAALDLRAVSFGATNTIFDGLEDAFKDIYRLLDSVRHARMRCVQADMEEKVSLHAEKLQKIYQGQVDVSPKFAAWKQTYEELSREYKIWQERQKLLDDSYRELTLYLWPGQSSNTSSSQWIAAGTQPSWQRGVCGFPASNPLSADITQTSRSYNPGWKLGENQSGDFSIDGGDKIIVGYKVDSHWQDGTNGERRNNDRLPRNAHDLPQDPGRPPF